VNYAQLTRKVLVISVRADYGGGPRHLELLLKHLPADIQAFVACPDEPPFRERFESLVGGRVFTLPHRRFDLSFARRLARWAGDQGVDLLHAHGKGAGVYARMAAAILRTPCVHTPHGVHVESYSPLKRRLYRAYENLTARWVDHLIFVSDEERAAAQAAGLWPRTPHSVIVNGVEAVADAQRARWRHESRQRLGVDEARPVIMTLSRFDYQKNMLEALEVAKRLPEALFAWIGEGDESALLARRARDERIANVRFLGKSDAPLPWLAAADAYLSTSRWEGLPLAVLEAMSLGLAVVASDVVGQRELLGEGAGRLYPLGDPAAAADALRALLRDSALRRQMGERARRIQRERYSVEGMAEATAAVYRRVMEAEDR